MIFALRYVPLLFLSLIIQCSLAENATWISSMNPTTFSNSTLINLLNRGGYAIISAGRNPSAGSDDFNLSDKIINKRLGNLSNDLTNIFLYSNVCGTYDGLHEKSFLVVLHNMLPDQERATICQLGAKYNQDSVIYVRQASPTIQQLIYTTGPFNGTYVQGEGYEVLTGNVTDNYSRVRLCPNDQLTFMLNFNFTEVTTGNNVRVETQELIRHHAQNRVLNQWYRSTHSIHKL